jgi:hypothetical protein
MLAGNAFAVAVLNIIAIPLALVTEAAHAFKNLF